LLGLREGFVVNLIIDFDGTIVEAKWPEIGEMKPNALTVINRLYDAGHKIVVNTCRVDQYAAAAYSWLVDNGFKFHAFNENLPELIEFYGSDTRKLSGDVYIDDKNLGGIPDDWEEIWKQLAVYHLIDIHGIEQVCTECGGACFDNSYPEVVFSDSENRICENCSIDFEEVEGRLQRREVTDAN